MLILKAQNVVSEGIPIVYVYQMHQQNGSFAQNVDSEDIPGSTNGVNRKARNNKLDGDRAPPTSTNVLIYKMGWPPRLQFLAPFHISCNPDINKVGNRSYMHQVVGKTEEQKATVEADKVKEESLTVAGGRCWKRVWLMALQKAGEFNQYFFHRLED